ncbi:uncharacterized protein APUU_30759S [Aspergillus puulaauensis]|uniref:Uncharacterized protein n=1 Tax=Aspergillus puulaauensis TaxID=1220207 RepID=A0A7R7XJQ4_9EURO|nr:uncharacterized protein APUU_30759S [Aspergillus puulaauensis]BCS22534.1 hypothetical protein APUU_30759S [Aspergillus puulaauensis]
MNETDDSMKHLEMQGWKMKVKLKHGRLGGPGGDESASPAPFTELARLKTATLDTESKETASCGSSWNLEFIRCRSPQLTLLSLNLLSPPPKQALFADRSRPPNTLKPRTLASS